MTNVKADKRVLILFAHPALEKSRVNKGLIRGINTIRNVTVNDLYQQYPELDIDVQREQELLLKHDVIIFHHPFFWYSTPAILKEWQDLVLEHGWAYGREGTALRGKVMFNVISTGGREEAYQKDGYNRFTIRELLAPLEQTAYLCGMTFLPPFVAHGTHRMQKEEIEQHAGTYRQLLLAITENRFDVEKAAKVNRLNQDIDAFIRKEGA
jgi:glutathione-regulated potassium-efflux system ancillary protein KefG